MCIQINNYNNKKKNKQLFVFVFAVMFLSLSSYSCMYSMIGAQGIKFRTKTEKKIVEGEKKKEKGKNENANWATL